MWTSQKETNDIILDLLLLEPLGLWSGGMHAIKNGQKMNHNHLLDGHFRIFVRSSIQELLLNQCGMFKF